MTLHLLDTNIVSHIIRRDQTVVQKRLRELGTEDVAISAVTKGEMLYGLAKRTKPYGLEQAINLVLETIVVLPWTSQIAETYGTFKAQCNARGFSLSDLDMMIAAHAVSLGAVLVSRDKAFGHIGDELKVVDWS